MSNIKNPNAMVIIWTYQDRLSHEQADKSSVNKVYETVLNTVSLISIKTSKSKSSPAGKFQFTMAPLKNWVSFISPGSWCAIMMTQDPVGTSVNKFSHRAKPNELKMIGRVNSVRAVVKVDENGARKTVYLVDGEDWGCVFKSVMYIDPAYQLPNSSIVGTSQAWNYANSKKQNLIGDQALPTTTKNVKDLIDLWGGKNSVFDQLASQNPNNVVRTESSFKIPTEMMRFLGESSDSIASIINKNLDGATGILSDYDTYSETNESVGIINPSAITGTHNMWDLLKVHCNEIVNELVTDIRWVDDKPKLTLYKRVRPFLTRPASGAGTFDIAQQQEWKDFDNFMSPRSSGNQSLVKSSISSSSIGAVATGDKSSSIIPSISSKFELVKRTKIPIEDVIAIDAGTNWRDKINFIEILADETNFMYNGKNFSIALATKANAQIFDSVAFAREGMKGLTFKTNFFPLTLDGKPDFFNPSAWKSVLAQWYFNNHNYLNGTVEFIGQNEHIQVGSNIMIDALVLGPTPNMSSIHKSRRGKTTYLLLHVESISHSFFADNNGGRHFRTTVQFTRGVLSDHKGKAIGTVAIDTDSSLMTPKDERNTANTITTSGNTDPDVQKVRGT